MSKRQNRKYSDIIEYFNERYRGVQREDYSKRHYNSRIFWNEPCQEMALNSIPDISGKKVLLIGVGAGEEVENFSSRGAIITSIDIVDRPPSRFLNKTIYLNMDAHDLGFKSGAFDIVYIQNVLFIVDEEIVSKEVFRVLKQNGYFIACDIQDMNFSQYILKKLFIPPQILAKYKYVNYSRFTRYCTMLFGYEIFARGYYLIPVFYYLLKLLHLYNFSKYIVTHLEQSFLSLIRWANAFCMFGVFVYQKRITDQSPLPH